MLSSKISTIFPSAAWYHCRVQPACVALRCVALRHAAVGDNGLVELVELLQPGLTDVDGSARARSTELLAIVLHSVPTPPNKLEGAQAFSSVSILTLPIDNF